MVCSFLIGSVFRFVIRYTRSTMVPKCRIASHLPARKRFFFVWYGFGVDTEHIAFLSYSRGAFCTRNCIHRHTNTHIRTYTRHARALKLITAITRHPGGDRSITSKRICNHSCCSNRKRSDSGPIRLIRIVCVCACATACAFCYIGCSLHARFMRTNIYGVCLFVLCVCFLFLGRCVVLGLWVCVWTCDCKRVCVCVKHHDQ